MGSVHAEISNASLARLERISKHPTISKGVHAVHVQLDAYDGVLASNIRRFVEHQNNCLLENLRLIEDPAMHKPMGFSEKEIPWNVEKVRSITQAWTAYSKQHASHSPTEKDLGYQELLERAFREYRRQYAEQQELIDSGGFSARVASAMAAMPAVKRLVIVDEDMCNRQRETIFSRPFRDRLLDDEKLCRSLYENQRMSCREQFDRSLGSDAIPVLPNLLAALGTVGVSITTLEIELSMLPDFSRLESTADDIGPRIASATRKLETFSLQIAGPSVAHRRYEFEVLRDFLAPIVSAERLERLSVSLSLWETDSAIDPASLPMVGIINARTSWPALSSVRLRSLPVRSSDLESLAKSVRSPGGLVWMRGVHLMDGSWADVLEVLRDGHKWASIKSPSGAECEEMSLEEYEEIFGRYGSDEESRCLSGAERYVRGWGTANPLLSSSSVEPGIDAAAWSAVFE